MTSIRFLSIAAILALVSAASSDEPKVGFGYSPVTAVNVQAMKLNHYFDENNKNHDPDFEWTFKDGTFTLKEGKGQIPVDLLKKMLPKDATAKMIEGKWKIVDDLKAGIVIEFTEIKGDGKAGLEKATYNIYKTAPTVVRIGEPQYVFAL